MVRGGDDDDPALDGRIGPAGDPGELDDHRLELAEAARRLGQAVEPRGRLGHRTRVERSDGIEDAVERSLVGGGLLGDGRPARHSAGPLRRIGRPATSRATSSAWSAMRWWAMPTRSR